MFEMIIVGVDGTERSRRAVIAATDLAHKYAATLILVYSYEPVPRYLGTELYEEAVAQAITHGEDVLEEAAALVDEEISVETDLLEGPPADAILRVVESRDADLVVIGSRGLGEIAAMALGSVGHKLIQHSQVPVLIVK